MEHKPEYRVKVEFYDDTTSEVVCFSDEPLMSHDDDAATQFYRTIDRFKKAKEEHESIFYPKEEGVE